MNVRKSNPSFIKKNIVIYSSIYRTILTPPNDISLYPYITIYSMMSLHISTIFNIHINSTFLFCFCVVCAMRNVYINSYKQSITRITYMQCDATRIFEVRSKSFTIPCSTGFEKFNVKMFSFGDFSVIFFFLRRANE